MWASQSEIRARFRQETLSTDELNQMYEELAEQQRYEIEAENAWLRVAENSMEDCPDWAR